MHVSRVRGFVTLGAVMLAAAACGVHTSQNGAVKILSIAPTTGSITGGIAVSIDGEGFDDGTGQVDVLFGAAPADVVSLTPTHIDLTLPSGLACGGVDVQVSNTHGTSLKSHAFNYTGGNGPVQVTDIQPRQGNIAGGTQVTITGSGFSGGVGLALGGLPLKNVQIVNDTTITAETPATVDGGLVDLAVRNCGSQASLPAVFTYTSGLYGAVIDMNFTHYINPNEFSAPTPRDYIDPYVAFVDPSPDSLVNPTPAPGTCSFNPTGGSGASYTALNAGTSVQLINGAQTLTLQYQANADGNSSFSHGSQAYYIPYDSNGDFTSGHFQTANFVPNATYSFDAAGGDLPAFSATDAFTTPNGYTVTAPDVTGGAPTVTKTGQLQFTWTGGQPGLSFEIQILGFDASGNSTGFLYCEVADSGSYLVKSTDMANFGNTASTEYLFITNRRNDASFLIPSNGAIASVISSYYSVGALIVN